MKHLLEVFKRFGLEHGQNYYRWYLIEKIILQALENQKLSSPRLNTNLILGKTSSSPSPFLPFKVSSAQSFCWKLYCCLLLPFRGLFLGNAFSFHSIPAVCNPSSRGLLSVPKVQLKTFGVSAFVVPTSKLWNKVTELFKSAELLTLIFK